MYNELFEGGDEVFSVPPVAWVFKLITPKNKPYQINDRAYSA